MELDQEIDAVEADEVEVEVDGVAAEELDTGNDEVELDDDGVPIVKDEVKTVEAWQNTEDEEEGELPDVPVQKHIKMKSKLKGRLKDKEDENDKLKAKLALLENSAPVPTALEPRPKPEDFESDEKYDEAFELWDDKRLEVKLAAQNSKEQQATASAGYKQAVDKAVDEHYGRQEELVASSGIKAEYFKEADTTVRETVDAILPKQGDAVTDHIISLLGEGSEKVMYFLGRNKAARIEFQGLLAEDKTGMKAMVYLGQQKERLTNPKKAKSKAPKPAAVANGDIAPSRNALALKKKYDAAHGKAKTQMAYNIKKQARVAKIDVSSW